MAGQVYVSRLLSDAAMERLSGIGYRVDVGVVEPPSRDELLAGITGAVAAVLTLTEQIDRQVLAAAGPQLRILANVAVGYDNIDIQAAKDAGVMVTNTPGVLDQASADHTFALILAVCRRVVEGDRLIRSGQDWVWGPRMLVGLDISAGATLGIVGYGRIGQAVARRARAFDLRVVATSGTRTSGTAADGTAYLPLEELLSTSDIVSLHVPLTAATRHLIDAAALARMKSTSYLINAARGGVVDETGLIAALQTHQIRGAALDVFEGEPRVNPAFLTLDNVVLTPHTASAGQATRDAMGLLAVRNVAAVLGGEPPITRVG